MNKIFNNTIRTGAVALASLLACYSCSDTWDEHYEPTVGGVVVDATLYQQIKADKGLSDFVEIIDATGYKALLDESQIVTVFAPVNGTFNKDSLLNEIAIGHKDLVIQRFVKNHIARYNYSSTPNEQSILMLNKKRTTFTDGIVGVDQIPAKSVNTVCTNGVLHVMTNSLPFHTNIYEYMETEPLMAEIYGFLRSYDEDSLDVNRSVYRGVDAEGNRIYVDSVLITANDAMRQLDSYIYEEDSDYIAIVPTNEAYKARYEEVKTYFNYNPNEEDGDSLQEYYANYYVLNTLFYNKNANFHQEDSLKSTVYNPYDPKYNVFYKPFEEGGILAPGNYVEKIECSNGTLYKVDVIPTTIYDAFFRDIEIECERGGSINQDLDEKGNGKYTKTCNYTAISENNDAISKGGYLDAQPSSTSGQPFVAFNIPNTLSGTYDMYVVTIPLRMGHGVQDADTLKPYQFRVNMFYRSAKEDKAGAVWPTTKSETLKNPADPTGKEQNFVSDPLEIDTIFLGTKTFTECYYNTTQVGVMMQIQAYVSSSQTKNYSRRMLLDEIILKPHKDPVEATEVKKTPKH